MTVFETREQQQRAGRKVGYLVSAAISAVMFYLINQSPGWEAASFLTDETPAVLGLVNASLIAGIVTNLVYVLADPPRLKALGDIVTLAIGFAAALRILQVFPFDFTGWEFPWDPIVRVLLVLGLVGSAIGMVVALVTLVRGGRSDT